MNILRKIFWTALISLPLTLSPAASATILDFVAEGNSEERGLADGTMLEFGGIWVEFSATAPSGDGFAYFDSGDAGLGVCGTIDSAMQCDPSNDDNLTFAETLTLNFFRDAEKQSPILVRIDHIQFRDKKHKLITGTSTHDPEHDKVYSLNGEILSMLNEVAHPPLHSMTFGYVGDSTTSPNQYYISEIHAVPEPATLLLLGLGALGLVAARRVQS